jgi:hypothetical protein
MAALRRLAAVGLVAAAAAPTAAAAAPITARTSLRPGAPLLGDRVSATAAVEVDDASIDPGRVRVVAGFAPLDVLAGPAVERRSSGGSTVLRFRWEVACLSTDCAPGGKARRVTLPPLHVTAARRDGSTAAAVIRWPALSIGGRVTAKEAAAPVPPFRLETDLPPPTYRASPSTLEGVLDGVTAALALGALVLVAIELARHRRRREERRLAALSPLERALLLAREAERREPADRRRALNLLARVLGGPGSGLGGTASELAWSPPEPSPEQIEAVVVEAEREAGPR